ncbi:MAG: RNase adapter RapZ [Bdellovibrionales bacterium]|nr:RNase adapter RapZ [Bdellovibrionales bacterium]
MNQNLDSSLIIVTGMSGAGKSSAQNILEDLGYYVVHNLPVTLLSQFLDYSHSLSQRTKKISLLPDLSSEGATRELLSFLKTCEACSIPTSLLFVDCKTEALIKRYSETRRPHPVFDPEIDRSLIDTIKRERIALEDVKHAATIRFDTSESTIHGLKRKLHEYVESLENETQQCVRVNFLSFGFKYGTPYDCDLLMDVRFIPNPYFVPGLREKTGLMSEVSDYVLAQPACSEFLSKYTDLLTFLIPKYVEEGKAYINIGIGCTGGKHRSVTIAQYLASKLSFKGCLLSAKHRDLGNE